MPARPILLATLALGPLLPASAAPVPKAVKRSASGRFGDYTDPKTTCTAEASPTLTVPPVALPFRPWEDDPPPPTVGRTATAAHLPMSTVASADAEDVLVGAGSPSGAGGRHQAAAISVIHTSRGGRWDGGRQFSVHGFD